MCANIVLGNACSPTPHGLRPPDRYELVCLGPCLGDTEGSSLSRLDILWPCMEYIPVLCKQRVRGTMLGPFPRLLPKARTNQTVPPTHVGLSVKVTFGRGSCTQLTWLQLSIPNGLEDSCIVQCRSLHWTRLAGLSLRSRSAHVNSESYSK